MGGRHRLQEKGTCCCNDKVNVDPHELISWVEIILCSRYTVCVIKPFIQASRQIDPGRKKSQDLDEN